MGFSSGLKPLLQGDIDLSHTLQLNVSLPTDIGGSVSVSFPASSSATDLVEHLVRENLFRPADRRHVEVGLRWNKQALSRSLALGLQLKPSDSVSAFDVYVREVSSRIVRFFHGTTKTACNVVAPCDELLLFTLASAVVAGRLELPRSELKELVARHNGRILDLSSTQVGDLDDEDECLVTLWDFSSAPPASGSSSRMAPFGVCLHAYWTLALVACVAFLLYWR